MRLDERAGRPIVSVSGVRGVVGDGLYPEDVARWGAAFGTFTGGGAVLVGRDTRASGPMLQAALTAGITSTGADAVDLGVCPTPTVQMAVPEAGAAGGVVVTASHNPAEWNALKFVGSDGRFLSRSRLNELIELTESGELTRARGDGVGRMLRKEDAVGMHLERITELGLLDLEVIRAARFTAVVDACNGAGFKAAPDLLEKLGCEVYAINCDSERPFPRGTEPVPENLHELEREVLRRKADVGFALDPDGDRLSLVSEGGVAVGEEYTLPIAIGYVLGRRPGPACANLSTSAMVDEVARSRGCELHRSPVGEANVVSLMIEKKCVVGGEGNGGVILPELHYGRDSLVGMALILAAMAERRLKLSSLCGELPHYSMIKVKIPWSGGNLEGLLQSPPESWTKARIDLADGIKATWKDRWIHCRGSGTEPVVRLIAEAPDQAAAQELIEEARARMAHLADRRSRGL